MDYCVVDVETANQARHSICQIGIAFFSGGKMVDGWESLVNPEADFSFWNIRVHGIRPEMVEQAPCWAQIHSKVEELLSGVAVASHTYFDQGALDGACLRDNLPPIVPLKWIDTCGLARQAWPALENHKLPTLARHFGIAYQSHDALEDARAAGEILALAMEAKNVTLAELLALPGRSVSSFIPHRPQVRAYRRRYAAF